MTGDNSPPAITGQVRDEHEPAGSRERETEAKHHRMSTAVWRRAVHEDESGPRPRPAGRTVVTGIPAITTSSLPRWLDAASHGDVPGRSSVAPRIEAACNWARSSPYASVAWPRYRRRGAKNNEPATPMSGREGAHGQQHAGRQREVDRRVLGDAERKQHAGRGADADDGAARGDRQNRRRRGHAEDDECQGRRRRDSERTEQQRAADGAGRPAAEEEAARGKRRAGNARMVADPVEDPLDPTRPRTSGNRTSLGPSARTAIQPRQKSSTTISGARKIAPLVAIAATASGSIATASTSPSETIERPTVSNPSRTPPSRRSVETLTT